MTAHDDSTTAFLNKNTQLEPIINVVRVILCCTVPDIYQHKTSSIL